MDPLVIPSIASAAGGWLANMGAGREAHKNRMFQERMAGSAYQRAVADMRSAGLNPALAYSQGGADSPGGAQASIGDVIGPAVSSAQQARKLGQELELMREQRILLYSQQRREDSQAELNLANRDYVRVQTQAGQYALPELRNQARLSSTPIVGPVATAAERLRRIIFGR